MFKNIFRRKEQERLKYEYLFKNYRYRLNIELLDGSIIKVEEITWDIQTLIETFVRKGFITCDDELVIFICNIKLIKYEFIAEEVYGK